MRLLFCCDAVMVMAYILAKIEAGREEEIFEGIRGLREVKRAAATFGVYDVVVVVEFERVEDLDEFLFAKLRKIPGIVETISMIVSQQIV
jgi:DNA-binding Lrp family transcriptional regulator